MAPPQDLFGLTGQPVDNLYQVERAIGEGGSSVVYRGIHVGLSEPIALKCLKLQTALDTPSIETFTRRFRDEGRLLYRLSQGNLDIVRCIASGTIVSTATGALIPYTVLEWLEGRSVSHDFRARRGKGLQGRTLQEVVTMFAPSALALDYAHRQGVVHRDVKPGNLYLQTRPDGTVRIKVLDFGLAKILDETIGITMAATAGSFMMCSPRYAAPEQFHAQIGKIGPWTDVYALALVLLEALRDQPVRKSDGIVAGMAEALDKKADLSATALGLKLPPRVERALLRAVTMDPGKRYATAGDLWKDLVEAMGAGTERAVVPVAVPDGAPVSQGDRIPDPPLNPGRTLAMENAPRQLAGVGTPVPAAGTRAVSPSQGPVPPSSGRAAPVSPSYRHSGDAPWPGGGLVQPWSGPPPSPPWSAQGLQSPVPPRPPQHFSQLSSQPPSQPPSQHPSQRPSQPPSQRTPQALPAPPRSGAAVLAVVLSLLMVALAVGTFYGMRAWQAHAATLRAP